MEKKDVLSPKLVPNSSGGGDGLKSTSRLNPKFWTPSCQKCWVLLAISDIPSDIDAILHKINNGCVDEEELFTRVSQTVGLNPDDRGGAMNFDNLLSPTVSPATPGSTPSSLTPLSSSLVAPSPPPSATYDSLEVSPRAEEASSIPPLIQLKVEGGSPISPPDGSNISSAASAPALPRTVSNAGTRSRYNSVYDDSFDGIGRAALMNTIVELIIQKTGKDAPLCAVCGAEEVKHMEEAVQGVRAQVEAYQAVKETIKTSSEPNLSEMQSELKELLDLEKQLNIELEEIVEEETKVSQEVIIAHQKRDSIDTIRRNFLVERNGVEDSMASLNYSTDSLHTTVNRTNILLSQLKRTNVMNDAFYIWYDGPFGTINGFRLGKIPIVNVEWGEVNAAWGQCALLLTTMANQLNFVFKTAEIIPMGSTSKLKALPGGSAQQLYWEGSYFGRSSFNTAMSLFLTCLQELGNYAESLDRASQLPYAVDKDKIGGLSIKYGREDAWTKALKFLLTNLKFMLAWVTKNDR